MLLRREAVPILMYSRVETSRPPDGTHGRFFPWITPSKFERHLKLLSRLGFRTLSFEEACKRHFSRERLPRKSVVLTFEGGHRSFYVHARPILEKYGFGATVFLATRTLQDGPGRAGGLVPPEALSPFMVRESAVSRIEFGVHGTCYRDLSSLGHDEIWNDLAVSRTALQQLLQSPPSTFAYPFGLYTRRTIRLILEGGFLGACTIRPGLDGPGVGLLTEEETFAFGRHPVSNGTGLLTLLTAATGLLPVLEAAGSSFRPVRAFRRRTPP